MTDTTSVSLPCSTTLICRTSEPSTSSARNYASPVASSMPSKLWVIVKTNEC